MGRRNKGKGRLADSQICSLGVKFVGSQARQGKRLVPRAALFGCKTRSTRLDACGADC